MGDVKGTGITFIKEEFKKRGGNFENKFLAALNADEKSTYTSALDFTWHPIEIVTSLYEKAAPVLFPGDPAPLRKIGVLSIESVAKGVYKFLLRFSTVEGLLQQAAKIWSTYQKEGTARMEKGADKNSCHFFVTDYPKLSQPFAENLAGYLERAIEMTGAKNVRVIIHNQSAGNWKWTATWS